MITYAISQVTNNPISVISVKTPPICNTRTVYKLNFSTFQLQEGVIPLDILHKVNQKTPQNLKIQIFNMNNRFAVFPDVLH